MQLTHSKHTACSWTATTTGLIQYWRLLVVSAIALGWYRGEAKAVIAGDSVWWWRVGAIWVVVCELATSFVQQKLVFSFLRRDVIGTENWCIYIYRPKVQWTWRQFGDAKRPGLPRLASGAATLILGGKWKRQRRGSRQSTDSAQRAVNRPSWVLSGHNTHSVLFMFAERMADVQQFFSLHRARPPCSGAVVLIK